MTFKTSKPLSLRMQLTLMTALLSAVSCLILSAYISTTAILSMDKIENSVIAVLPLDALKNPKDTTFIESQDELSEDSNSSHLFSSDITNNLNDYENTSVSNTSDTAASPDAFSDSSVDASGLYLDIQGDLSAEIQNTRSEFWTKSLLATLFIVIASSLLVYLAMGYALKPLAEFTEHIEKISDQNIEDEIIVPHASKEILRLTDVFNAMMKRLSRAFTMQRQFAWNAAHELRTPLAVMQTKLDVYYKQDVHSGKEYEELIDMCSNQTAGLSHVVNLLLEMTSLQGAPRTDRISLAALIEEVICDLTPVAEQKNITLVQNEGDAVITGNDTLIYRAVYNLTENAIKYNRDGGSVTLSVSSDTDYAVINIEDTGTGIAEEYRDRIFEPFFRAEKLDLQSKSNLRDNLRLSPQKSASQSKSNLRDKLRLSPQKSASQSKSNLRDKLRLSPQKSASQGKSNLRDKLRLSSQKSASQGVRGAGLGLALVKEIATEHGGDVYVTNSSDAGTCIAFKIRV